MVKSNPAASSLAQVLAASRRFDTMSCDDHEADEVQRASDMTDEEREAIEARLLILPSPSSAVH